MEVRAQRPGDLFAEHCANGLARDTADDFADKVALRDGMIAGRAARLPERGLRRQQARGLLPVIEVVIGNGLAPA